MPYIGKIPAPVPLTSADLVDNIIETAKINDDAVTADKLANSINSEIAANTAKTGITSGQASAITANTAKTGITSGQASAITANTAKVTYPSADSTKLGGIEASADVTDATNVTAAGALMDSEVTNLADVKAFAFGSTVQAYDADTTKNDVANTFTANQTYTKPTIYTGEAGANAIDFTKGSNIEFTATAATLTIGTITGMTDKFGVLDITTASNITGSGTGILWSDGAGAWATTNIPADFGASEIIGYKIVSESEVRMWRV